MLSWIQAAWLWPPRPSLRPDAFTENLTWWSPVYHSPCQSRLQQTVRRSLIRDSERPFLPFGERNHFEQSKTSASLARSPLPVELTKLTSSAKLMLHDFKAGSESPGKHRSLWKVTCHVQFGGAHYPSRCKISLFSKGHQALICIFCLISNDPSFIKSN